MEETLGKRIVFHRKRLGLTQDALAELMGVTAQAVSKWENDQSCPDIGALPKLAEIFGISTDELLGVERKEVHPAEIVPADGEENDVHPEMTWELPLDDGKKGGIGLAIWILLVGGIMLTSYLLNFHAKLWDVVWPSALLVFGIFGLFPRFSFFRLGCSLFGLYFLMSNLNFAPFRLGRSFFCRFFCCCSAAVCWWTLFVSRKTARTAAAAFPSTPPETAAAKKSTAPAPAISLTATQPSARTTTPSSCPRWAAAVRT